MNLIPNEFYHIYNRGNNKQRIFFNDSNYIYFLKKIREQIYPISEIIAWCLMPNHFHLIIMANEKTIAERTTFGGKPMQEFPYRIGILLSSYAQAINKQNNTTGSLFQQKTKAKLLYEEQHGSKESYLANCFHYIHQNPLRAGIVKNLIDWPYSSYPDYVSGRNGNLCNKKIFFSVTGFTTKDIIEQTQMKFTEEMTKSFMNNGQSASAFRPNELSH